MKLNTKWKENLFSDGCYDTIVSVIGNIFVEVSWTEWKITLVGFDDDLPNTILMIEASETINDLPNGNIIVKLIRRTIPWY